MVDRIEAEGKECTLVTSETSFEEAEVLKLLTGYKEEHGDYISKNIRMNHKS